jgi:hypothetical protein
VDGEGKLTVDGTVAPVWFTSSKGWAKDDASIDYVWLTHPKAGADGKEITGYITLDYGKSAAEFVKEVGELTSGEGKANREDPKRQPRDPAKEAGRITQFQTTMAKKATAATSGQPDGAASGQTPPSDEPAQTA